MSNFDEIRKKQARRDRTCSRCSEPAVGAIQINAKERQTPEGGGKRQRTVWRHIVSDNELYCERHLIAKYKELKGLL